VSFCAFFVAPLQAGVAVEQDSIHINLQNPASFANLKMTTLLSEERIMTTLKSDTRAKMPQEQR
jgi:hypothetical protein